MPAQYRTPRLPSQLKIQKDADRFVSAASRLLFTIQALEANGMGISAEGIYLNPLSPIYETIITARNAVRQVQS